MEFCDSGQHSHDAVLVRTDVTCAETLLV